MKIKTKQGQRFPFGMEEEGEHHMDSKCALPVLSAHMECKLSSEEEAWKVFNIWFLIINMAMWSN